MSLLLKRANVNHNTLALPQIFKFLSIILLIGISSSCEAQLDRGTWLVGGTGNFRSDKNKISPDLNIKSSSLSITPRIGYFLSKKFAAGAAVSYSRSVTKAPARNVANIFGAGPFIRYYFLPDDKRCNLLVEPSFIYSVDKGTGMGSTDYATYALNAGPAIFLSNSIAAELLVGYQYRKVLSTDINTTSFIVSLGLQIYLEHQ